MKFAKLDENVFALRLEPGDDVHASIQGFCAGQNIANAQLTGLGSIDSPTLAHYRMDQRAYHEEKQPGIFEVTSLIGNVALIEGKPAAHIHLTIADEHMQARAGHLVRGTCSATVEIILTAYPSHYTKHHDEKIGLNVWDFTD